MTTRQAILTVTAGRIPYPGIQTPIAVAIITAGVTNTEPALKRKLLTWEYDNKTPTYRRVTDGSLMAFASLAAAKEASIKEYAKQHGVLEAMEVHSAAWHIRLDTDGSRWQLGRAVAQLHNAGEPIELWRKLARRMHAVLRIAAAFKGNSKLKRYLAEAALHSPPENSLYEDWEFLAWGAAPPASLTIAQQMFAKEINWWLEVGEVRPQIGMSGGPSWNDAINPWRMEMAYTGLIGGLAYRLLLIVIGEDKLYACDECGEPYIRLTRAPQPGQENFCPNCPDAAKRRAVERHRSGKRQPK